VRFGKQYSVGQRRSIVSPAGALRESNRALVERLI